MTFNIQKRHYGFRPDQIKVIEKEATKRKVTPSVVVREILDKGIKRAR